MATEISAVSNISFASAGARAVSSLRGGTSFSGITGAADTVLKPIGGSPGRFVEVRAALNRADTRTALDTAVAAGTGILSALKDLRSGFRVAASSVVNPSANLHDGNGSRVSALNIQAQAGILLDAIDKLVKSAEISGANLISSTGLPVRLQTTAFGGGLNVLPQPFDSVGLGLDNVNLIANGGVDAALAAVNKAIYVAEQRLERLEILQRAAGGATSVNRQFLARALSGAGASPLDRGALVDLVG
ncbi:MAG: hypothetical protein HOH04_15070 [Rhodospirillaceae bacterium]|nr:hypothetical protein [Rhodospirillaceae bacterium]